MRSSVVGVGVSSVYLIIGSKVAIDFRVGLLVLGALPMWFFSHTNVKIGAVHSPNYV